jgi:hypothetical protein
VKPECPVARRSDYKVRAGTRGEAAALVERWHYARGAANTCVAAHILERASDGVPVGATLWMPPTKAAAASVSADWRNVLCLSRLVVAPGESQNAAGLLLARSMRMLPARWHTLLTYADSRMGHTGTVYKATNWICLGATRGRPAWVDADGRQVARKATKSRTAAEMLALGLTRLPQAPKIKFVYFR